MIPTKPPAHPTILIDTREQTPLNFAALGLPTIRATLKTGDYSIEGFANKIVVERKSVNDFLGSIVSDRFWREMQRMTEIEHRVIVIDNGGFRKLKTAQNTTLSYNTIVGFVNKIIEEYDTPVVLCGDRAVAAHFAAMWLFKCYKIASKQKVDYPQFNEEAL